MSGQMLRINQQMVPHLTESARRDFEVLTAKGFDADLALAIVEGTRDEVDTYVVPEAEDDGQEGS